MGLTIPYFLVFPKLFSEKKMKKLLLLSILILSLCASFTSCKNYDKNSGKYDYYNDTTTNTSDNGTGDMTRNSNTDNMKKTADNIKNSVSDVVDDMTE